MMISNMKKTALFILLLALLPAIPSRAGKIVTDSLKSAVLDTQVRYNVYLPDGYDKSEASYPVVYLLHGLYGIYSDWQVRGTMKGVADDLISGGSVCPMIIVMPNAGHEDAHNHWNGYFNMPGWSYEDFFFQEFVPTVEKKYRCIADKGHRAIMGLSMGGGGSTVYCQRHPEMFSSCYAMSPWLDNEENAVRKPRNEGDKLDIVCQSVCDHSALKFVTSADEATLEKLRTVAWTFDCGDDDFLLEQTMQMHRNMRAARVKSEMRVRNGVHNWEYWHQALRLALPFASNNFD